jgi:CDP-diglyceride synthetase
MWHNVIEHFLTALVGASVAGLFIWLAGRKSPRWILLMILMPALVSSVPQIVFGYFPELHKGWRGFAVGMGVALVVCLPFSFFMGWKPRV